MWVKISIATISTRKPTLAPVKEGRIVGPQIDMLITVKRSQIKQNLVLKGFRNSWVRSKSVHVLAI